MKFKKTTASSLITLLLIAVFFVTGASFASASTVGPTYPPPGGPANPPTQQGQIDDCSVIGSVPSSGVNLSSAST